MKSRRKTPADSVVFVVAAACVATLSGCSIGANNNEPSIAAARAFQFLDAVVVQQNADHARELMVTVSRPGAAEWSRLVAEVRGPSPPARVRAVGFAYVSGAKALDIFFEGDVEGSAPRWRVRVEGDLDEGYRVAAVERLEVLPQSTLPLQASLATDPATVREAPAGARVSFVAIDADPDMVSELARHYAGELSIETDVLEPIVPDARSLNDARKQLIANELALNIRERFHEQLATGDRTVIAITGRDMYIRGMSWRFAMSYRMPPQIAVVSYFWMDPQAVGKAPDTAVTRARLRKMIAKNIGLLVYGLPASTDPSSLLFRDILGVHELDNMVEDYQRAGMRRR
jgi:predicted Zn-dependent protease